MEIELHEPADVEKAARQLLENFPTHHIFVLKGELGVGKTTLIKAICRRLGVQDITSSPSFAIVNTYSARNGANVHHLDLYRMRDEEEAYDLGLEELFDGDEYCFIEWPEILGNLLPSDHVIVELSLQEGNERTVKAESERSW